MLRIQGLLTLTGGGGGRDKKEKKVNCSFYKNEMVPCALDQENCPLFDICISLGEMTK